MLSTNMNRSKHNVFLQHLVISARPGPLYIYSSYHNFSSVFSPKQRVFQRKTNSAEFTLKGPLPSPSPEPGEEGYPPTGVSTSDPRCNVVKAVHHGLCSEEAIREASDVFEDLQKGLGRLDVA